MTTYHDEVELEDFEYDEEVGIYYYPCPCGDQFEISREELLAGEEEATCPSCSLVIKVIFDKEQYREQYGSAEAAEDDEVQQRDLDDFEYDEDSEIYSYPCSCGDRYQSLKAGLLAGNNEARCCTCLRALKITYDKEGLSARFEEVLKIATDKECVKQTG